MPVHVLIIDDEPQIRKALRINLEARTYNVSEAPNGRGGLRLAADHPPDIVLLDLGLPDIDGVEVLEGLRGWTDVPVIVLTARDDEAAKIAALDAGADDYVTKPFGIGELLARMRASLRRVHDAEVPLATITNDSFTLNLAEHLASAKGTDVKLTPIEWGIVQYVAQHPNRLVTHRQLVTAVWGAAYEVDLGLIRVHMSHVRSKLELDPSRPVHFITEPGMGYRFSP